VSLIYDRIETTAACKQIKAGKDKKMMEFILHSGKFTQKWLACLYTDVLRQDMLATKAGENHRHPKTCKTQQ